MTAQLFNVLNDELNNQHGSRLEWIIIVLIMSEVALALVELIRRDLMEIF